MREGSFLGPISQSEKKFGGGAFEAPPPIAFYPGQSLEGWFVYREAFKQWPPSRLPPGAPLNLSRLRLPPPRRKSPKPRPHRKWPYPPH